MGLSTAVCFAAKFHTAAIDIDSARVVQLNSGRVPIHEKGLKPLLEKGLKSRRLSFSSEPSAVEGSDALFIAVGTPSNQDGSIDLAQVRAASVDIGGVIKRAPNKPLVMVRSTVIPGTAREVVKPLLEQSSGKTCGTGFGLCSNPEFLREGTAIQDTMLPQRIVLGPFDDGSLHAASALYRRFYGKKTPPTVVTTPEGAELVKYGSNSLLASRVSFINLIARVCELFPGTDVGDVALGIGLDPRIGRQFLQAGPGFGGSCFPKDIRAFSAYLEGLAIDSSILKSVLRINDFQPEHVVALAEAKAGPLGGKKVAVLGLAFKAETGDVRESRSIPVVKMLLEKGASVHTYDPAASLPKGSGLDSAVRSPSVSECLRGADLAIVMTAWRQFKALRPRDFQALMRTPVLLDARRVYDPKVFSRTLQYFAVGRGEDEKR